MATPDELRELEEDWDGYGGKPIDERCIQVVLDICQRSGLTPNLIPCCDGGVAIEIYENGLEIDLSVSPETD